MENNGNPESGHSSPHARENEYENPPAWEDPLNNYKVKFMCSYGGKIQPRAHDNQLSYIGGETKILAVERMVKFDSLLSKAIALCDCVSISLKYQLPGEDLDALISIINDEDMEHLMNEYDRLNRISTKSVRLRIFIFQSHYCSLNSSDLSFGFDDTKTPSERYIEALNSAPIFTARQQLVPQAVTAPPLQPQVNNMDFLFGFDKSDVEVAAPPAGEREEESEDRKSLPGLDEGQNGSDSIQKHLQELEWLRIDEQLEIDKKKNDESLSSGSTGSDYNKMREMHSQTPIPGGGVPYWKEKPFHDGVFPANTFSNEPQFYIIPASAFHATMMRPVNGPPIPGYYTIQRIPVEVFRELQQHPAYSMIPPQGCGGGKCNMARPTPPGVGVVAEAGYAQMAYDSSAGKQGIYSAPGGVMAAQYQHQAVNPDIRPTGALNVEAVVKVAAKATQASV